MQFKASKRSDASVNLTPLIDIVFLLLVFFLLTAHFVEDQRLNLSLPQTESGDTLPSDPPLTISVDAQGVIRVNGQIVLPEALKLSLQHALAAAPKGEISIRGDQQTPLAVITHILDIAHQAGAKTIDIITEKP